MARVKVVRQTKRQPQCGTCIQKPICKEYNVKSGSDDCLEMLKRARNKDYAEARKPTGGISG